MNFHHLRHVLIPSLRTLPRRAFAAGALLLSAAAALHADTADVVSKANTLIATSVASGASPTVKTSAYTLAIAKQWTNLPGGTRNGPTIGGGSKALSTDLSDTIPSGQTISPRDAAVALAQAALSDAGYNTMEEIRHADDVIRSTDNTQSWNYSNYHIAILGTPSTTDAWMLQISGHHLTYNITYNAPYVSATPMFIGTEPPDYYSIGSDFTTTEKAVVVGTVNGVTEYLVSQPYNATSSTTTTTTDPGIANGTHRAPLDTQRAAVSALATSLQADSANASAAKLTGTFSDVVLGVTSGGGGGGPGGPGGPGGGTSGGGDSNFPFIGTTPTYPTGTTGRGVLYTSLTTAEKAQVKAMIDAWVKTQADDISDSLLADYESDAALAQTYVGYQVGAGAADGGSTRCNFDAFINQEATPINSQNSYIRVDGPRVWIEMVVQAAVAYRSQNWVHYHSLWRDKLADYGNEFGGYLDTTSTSTTYTRPTITTEPASYTVTSGGSATFSVAATGTGTLNYQWYRGSDAISGATDSTYTTSTAGSYFVVVTNLYGAVASGVATLTINSTVPAITSDLTVSGKVGVAFAYQITASNNPTSFSAKGLAPGLGLSTTTGKISGTPTTAGTYSVVLGATNSSGTGTATMTLVITPEAPVINSSLTASARQGVAFAYTITATNSPTSYGESGMPAGLSINQTTGKISGTPTVSGTFSVIIKATNSGGSDTETLSLVVKQAVPVITSALTPPSRAGVAFVYQITATNSPTSFGASGLPSGLSLDTSTGKITGKPTKPGTYTVTIAAFNGGGYGSARLTLTVKTALAPAISSTLTASATVGTAFTYQITATNTPTSFATQGLPGGLGVSASTGKISGTPTKAGTYSVTIKATNSGGTGTATLKIVVKASA